MKLGKYDAAKDLLVKSASVYKTTFPENHIANAWISSLLANLYVRLGDRENARPLLTSSLAIYKNYYGVNHIETVRLTNEATQIYRVKG